MKIITGKPNDIPKTWGNVRRKPKFAPEAATSALFEARCERRGEGQDAQCDKALKSHLTTPLSLGEIRYQSTATLGRAAFDPGRAQNIGASNHGP